MKKEILKIFAVVLIVTGVVTGVQYASAYSKFTVPTIFNSSATQQEKTGGLFSEILLGADLGFFKKFLAPGSTSWVNIGGKTETGLTSEGGNAPLAIVVDGVSREISDGQYKGTHFIGTGDSCIAPIGIVNQNSKVFEFKSSALDYHSHADLFARQIGLNGGAPSADSVLAAVDSDGNAVWAKLEIRNGEVVVVENGGSPIIADTSCAVVPDEEKYQWSESTWGQCKPFNVDIGPIDIGPIDIGPIDIGPIDMCFNITSFNCFNSVNYDNYSQWKSVPSSVSYDQLSSTTTTQVPGTVGLQTRTVLCKNSKGQIVDDSLCSGLKPDSIKNCQAEPTDVVTNHQYRILEADVYGDSIVNPNITPITLPAKTYIWQKGPITEGGVASDCKISATPINGYTKVNACAYDTTSGCKPTPENNYCATWVPPGSSGNPGTATPTVTSGHIFILQSLSQ